MLFIFIFFLLFLINSNATSKDCLSFVPYGWNDFYVHLPQNTSFCVEVDGSLYNYKTDIHGGRILSDDKFNDWIQVFGDSQVVGLDLDEIQKNIDKESWVYTKIVK